ncbi:MAG: Yip1 family protein [Vicinamibacteria bacterium]
MALLERIKGVLFDPKAEWVKIAAEPATVQSIYTRYVMLLAAIGPVALFARYSELGAPWALRLAVATYVITLVMVFVLAMAVDVLAPSFGGQKDFVASLKLVAYSSTIVYVAGIVHLIGWFAQVLVWIAGVYALYTFFLGAPILKRCSADKAVPLTLAIALGVIALYFVASFATGARKF